MAERILIDLVDEMARPLKFRRELERSSSKFEEWWLKFSSWPPDVFGLTALILQESGAYRVTLSTEWDDFVAAKGKTWEDEVSALAENWKRWAENPTKLNPPGNLSKLGEVLRQNLRMALRELAGVRTSGSNNLFVHDLMLLHGAADQACKGFGIASSESTNNNVRAWQRLDNDGTLSDLAPERVRVLPKLRTPVSGITLNALSHHLCAVQSEIDVKWRRFPHMCDPEDPQLNLLVIPWPLEKISANSFTPCKALTAHRSPRDRRFTFDHQEPGVAKFVIDALEKVRSTTTKEVHGIVFPECALRPAEVSTIQSEIQAWFCEVEKDPDHLKLSKELPFILAGIREKKSNYALLAHYSPTGKWVDNKQHKHHPWCIEQSQIENYHIASRLSPAWNWWEDLDLQNRELHFSAANNWLTFCHLICEDLARPEPVSNVIRAVGPNLLVALLLDGPQLSGRWPGRYASVFADEPGTSVLTVTSLGMVKRSRPSHHPPSQVIALWKDQVGGVREIALEQGANAVLLTMSSERITEYTADGRSDGNTGSRLVLSSIEQVFL